MFLSCQPCNIKVRGGRPAVSRRSFSGRKQRRRETKRGKEEERNRLRGKEEERDKEEERGGKRQGTKEDRNYE